MKDRKYMLKVIWRSIDTSINMLHSFKDGTNCFFMKGLKLEQDGDSYQLYNTNFEVYKPLPDSAVWYAYTKGMPELSKSMQLSKAEERVGSKRFQITDAMSQKLHDKVSLFKRENVINLNQIKEYYEQQREDCQAV